MTFFTGQGFNLILMFGTIPKLAGKGNLDLDPTINAISTSH